MRLFFFLLFALMTICCEGQTLPGWSLNNAPDTARVFAKDEISDGFNNRDFNISPDGNELLFTIQSRAFLNSTIIRMRKMGGKWNNAEIAPFSGKYKDLEAFYAPDGKTLYFSSNRPSDPSDTLPDFDIWKVEKTNGDWGRPVHLDNNINSPNNEFYPSVSKTGNLYFTSDNGAYHEDIFISRLSNGQYQPKQALDSAVNTKGYEFNAYVDPDERFILFSCQQGRADDMGGGDLYISRKNAQGNWQPAENMGPKINSTTLDYCPFVYKNSILFFSSARPGLDKAHPGNYETLKKLLSSAGNGFDDIYWVKFSE